MNAEYPYPGYVQHKSFAEGNSFISVMDKCERIEVEEGFSREMQLVYSRSTGKLQGNPFVAPTYNFVEMVDVKTILS